jgi:hydrogenase-1 operon protein HyaF
MAGLASIPVSVELVGSIPETWGNSLPILHEIRHGLERLAATGESTRIDLSSIPFGPGDEERLLEMLGDGEVEANIDALGPTRAWETAIHGVWLVDYRNVDGQRLILQIEIATVPDIVRTQPQDIQDAIEELDIRIQAGPGDTNSKS